jgi:DNA polymerase-3 subunit alpha (Gram-positive type)
MIEGEFKPDQYQKNEITGWINKIVKIPTPKKFIREDDSPKQRIELLAHTKMSAFDGICSTEQYQGLAKNFNMKAIGFADRYNCQSYPDIMKSIKTGVPAIYGYECDLQKEIIECVKNPIDQKINDATYVVFDIETTGFYAEYEDIIEFGAIKVKNNSIIDKLDFFIKPFKSIPAKITELTHISNEMVENGMNLTDALVKITE